MLPVAFSVCFVARLTQRVQWVHPRTEDLLTFHSIHVRFRYRLQLLPAANLRGCGVGRVGQARPPLCHFSITAASLASRPRSA
ncbi:hypothetical protein C8T65DRAFT_638067 [Cerioporus squamosus]|nr:hypothetical protein C8T65DRAFT_638067 [Cerioporus squamosus]